MNKRQKEGEVQKAIQDYLSYKKIFHYRNNTGGFQTDKGHFYRFGALGSPDIICVKKGKYIGIECKGTGGRQSDNQKSFQKALEKAGGKYILAYSLDDVTKVV